MKCTVCNKESTWLEFIGSDAVCQRCVNKNSIMGNLARTHTNTFHHIIKKIKPANYEEYMKISKEDAREHGDLTVLNRKK